MGQLRLWLKASRAKLFPISLFPVLVGGFAAHTAGNLRPGFLFGTLIAVLGLHAGSNIWNDYCDECFGTDRLTVPTPFSGGSRVIQEGYLTAQTMRQAAIIISVISTIILLWISLVTQPLAILFLLSGGFAAWSYSAPPLRLAGRGWGEIAVGLAFGPLLTGGVYLIQTGALAPAPLLAGGAIGLLVMTILCLNEIPDKKADAMTAKENWAVRMEDKVFERLVHILLVLAYLIIVGGGLSRTLPLTTWTVLLTLPLAVGIWKGIRSIREGNCRVNGKMISLFSAFTVLLMIGFLIN